MACRPTALAAAQPAHAAAHTEYDCSSLAWQDCLLVVNDGAVVLSCTEGDLALDRGAVFFLTGLHAPTLATPTPRRPLSQPPVARLAFPRVGRRRSRPSNPHHPCRAN